MTAPTPLEDYFESAGIGRTPCDPAVPDHPAVAIPQPAGWDVVPTEAFPGTYHVLARADRVVDGFAPNAVVMHFRLDGGVDVDDLLDSALDDVEHLADWNPIQIDATRWNGHRSLYLKGTYTQENWNLAVTTRHVVVETDTDIYLVQLTVTMLAEQLEELGGDVTVINIGLTLV
ncbi:MAG: hypothetical protein GX542_02025 [Rhodococcus sp.]|nr:hypothetical protein [Rhodococcus sp. (in: high G+C Gram-positive bacteria)]